ncbi:bifunctional serine/threonine-protein kinase/formylglycine-generating enzyme family protein [Simiduia agarivorans]|uniref:non-specific serine/threonine protein kinase n=1 Tax=Simiduia agarivorans (strain DSM 21679 / JCM 13881 / BCRC 17597 / SA1) TaxID=1117647 RepID=K4KES8_SIMAS|nr:bifunctional serine/threonine-protein kinase/formylglycine-generating enzyme family protein [Simiduia agarivorans]AFU97446.1 serine/threonine protein kinase PpkA [Simiduia agarivorans SA1 = DSM 21679]
MQIPGYRIIRKINQGGMSTVYLAIQLSVGREVALKVMSPALNADPVFSERFQREANIVGQLSHPNIVSIYDIGRYKNLNYIAMDYLPGGSVHDKMATGLSTSEILRIVREMALALDLAHEKGYIHRDIKPENILFRENNSAVLSDFGVAKTVSSASQMTNAGMVVGTPHYMSPEQARGKAIDGRSDIYSLGVVFYEMLTGTVPYKAEEAVAIAIKHLTAPIPKLPPQYSLYQKLLNTLLAKDPDDRFQRGREIVNAIDELDATLSGSRPRYMSNTEPSAMHIASLFKALVLTSYAALSAQAKAAVTEIARWRWSPKRSFYRRPDSTVTEIRTNPDSGENDRTTVVSTRIQKAAYFQAGNHRTGFSIARVLSIVLVVGSLWFTFSVALIRFHLPGENHYPIALRNAAIFSAALLNQRDLTAPIIIEASEPEPLAQMTSTPQPVLRTPEPEVAETEINESEALPTDTLPDTDTPEAEVAEPAPEPIPEPPPAPRFALTVNPEPVSARVRILNIKEKYQPGIALLPDRYLVEVTAEGYHTYKEWVRLGTQDRSLDVSLRKVVVPGTLFKNELANGDQGPEMVIIPAGTFTMGDKGSSVTMPERRVTIDQPFAVSRFEITFADFDKFLSANNLGQPDDERWGRGSRPVINVSWEQARAYTQWLSESTGKKYRLPTEAEWEFLARANSEGDYWWTGDAKKRANCRNGCQSDYAGLFTTKTAPVGSYNPNAFGVHDTAGNVAEWVEDCFQNHYLSAPRDASAVKLAQCDLRSVRGGSMKDSAKDITVHHREGRDASKAYNDVGFRVVVELY